MDVEVKKREDERFDLWLGNEYAGNFVSVDEAIHYAECHGEKVNGNAVK